MADQNNSTDRGLAAFAGPLAIVGLIVVAVLVATPFILHGMRWLLCCWFGETGSLGSFGDQFGFANAIFSGIALLGVVYAVLLQTKQLKQQEQLSNRRAFDSRFFSMIAFIPDKDNQIEKWKKDNPAQGQDAPSPEGALQAAVATFATSVHSKNLKEKELGEAVRHLILAQMKTRIDTALHPLASLFVLVAVLVDEYWPDDIKQRDRYMDTAGSLVRLGFRGATCSLIVINFSAQYLNSPALKAFVNRNLPSLAGTLESAATAMINTPVETVFNTSAGGA